MNERTKEFFRAVESRALPLLFVYFCVEQAGALYYNRADELAALRGLPVGALELGEVMGTSILIVRLLLLLVNATSVYFLLKAPRREVGRIEEAQDVVVPLASTFFILATNVVAYLPASSNFRMIPERWDSLLSLLGMQLAVFGALLSLAGLMRLGDSFSVFVERRRLVTTGPYRFVRHPIYLGHVIRMIGYWLTTTYTHHLLITAAGIFLLWYRARLEDARLAQDPAYSEYRGSTDRSAPKLNLALGALIAFCVGLSISAARRIDSDRLKAFEGITISVDGPGLPVIFVHGAGGSKDVWINQLIFLDGHHRALALDLLRRSYYGVPPGDAGALLDTVRDIEAAAAAYGLQRFVLVGHSFGSHTVIEYARRHPDQVAGLLLVDPSGDYRWVPERFRDTWLARFEDHKRRMSIWSALLRKSLPATRGLVLRDLKVTPEWVFRQVGDTMFKYDPATPFGGYQGPKLSVFSSCGHSASDAKFAPLPRNCMTGVSHWVMLDDPEKFNRILGRFLDSIPPDGGRVVPDRPVL